MGSTLQNVIGAILVALMLAVGANILGNTLIPAGEKAAFVAHEPAETPKQAAPEPGAPTAAPAVSLASGDAKAGQAAARKCAACHTFDQGGANRVGPNLHDIVGTKMAGKEGFKYSDGLRAKAGTWSYEALDQFLTKPAAFVPGTKMAFAGVADAKERADIIAYLRSISPNAPPPQG